MDKHYVKIIVERNEEEAFFDVVKAAGTHGKFVIDVENSRGYGGMADAFLSALREALRNAISNADFIFLAAWLLRSFRPR